MLILSRKKNEKIRIGTDVVVQVLSISESQVKIGIDAPASVKILRDEIYEDVKKHTIEATIQSKEKPAPDLSELVINKLNKGK
ncbi:MAG: carbon storage regulator CsrA [Chlorobi bacterium]|nr:carbon storage regulator CsrA [Chlorobiota bacterium]